MLRGKAPSGNWTATYERIREFKKKMDERSRYRGAKVYEMRLFDLVLGNEKPTRSKNADTQVFCAFFYIKMFVLVN